MSPERSLVRHACIHQGARIVDEAAPQYLFHTLATVIIIFSIVGFRDSVGVENQCIARVKLVALNFVLDAGEHAEWKTGGFDPLDGRSEERRVGKECRY